MTPEELLCQLTKMSNESGLRLWVCENSSCCGGINLATGSAYKDDTRFPYERIMWDDEVGAYIAQECSTGKVWIFHAAGREPMHG